MKVRIEKEPIRALIITGNSARHNYFLKILAANFVIVGLICDPKKNYYEDTIEKSDLVRRHFVSLKQYELACFNSHNANLNFSNNVLESNEINSTFVQEWSSKLHFDVILVFGSGILGDHWISNYPEQIINLHLGLSPRYRGSATLFWPFANDELEFLGTTIHILTKGIDSGPILKSVKPKELKHLNYYEITNNLIRDSIDIFPNVVRDYLLGKIEPSPQDPREQKYYYRKSDFNEQILSEVLAKYAK